MAVPLATTTIAVLRVPVDATRDPYDAQPAADTVASGVRAHISSPSGREHVAGGSQEVVEFRLACDPVDLRHTDRVQDEQTGSTYEVVWARPRQGLGLDHIEAGLKQVSGGAR
ncbi:MAG: hypothetical protein FJ035_01235 [Chloroflexi bacterium]|nr:hypothetical protein [Chloroflexota bacterium]